MRKTHLKTILVTLLLLPACGDDPPPTCNVDAPSVNCAEGTFCEDVGGKPTCTAPLYVRGKVTSTAGMPIADALVAALDANDAPTSGTAKTDAMGNYELRLPSPREAGGAPAARKIKLRAAASGFESFPSGLRRSLPVEVSTAMTVAGKLVIENAATQITLEPVPNPQLLGSIAGTVRAGTGKSGALIVATGPATLTTTSDTDGAYVIFNAPAGAYTVQGYAAGLQLQSASATVVPATRAGNVDLVPRNVATGTVSGEVNLVNPGAGSVTSVVLVVEETFSPTLLRGAVPPGLRAPKNGAPSVTKAWTIEGVPAGKYAVLAAFENDNLVRDPDTGIGGTEIQHITVGDAQSVPLSASFKVTGALDVVSPGAGDVPDEVSGTPMFVFKDDSGEEKYTIEVFDSKGNRVWGPTDSPKVTGSANVTIAYGGPALTPGQLYQFRALSWDKGGNIISTTEDLKGIFLAK